MASLQLQLQVVARTQVSDPAQVAVHVGPKPVADLHLLPGVTTRAHLTHRHRE